MCDMLSDLFKVSCVSILTYETFTFHFYLSETHGQLLLGQNGGNHGCVLY